MREPYFDNNVTGQEWDEKDPLPARPYKKSKELFMEEQMKKDSAELALMKDKTTKPSKIRNLIKD